MNWIDAGPAAALRDGEAISIVAGRRMIAVARSGEEFFAVEDICTHDGAELTGGAFEVLQPARRGDENIDAPLQRADLRRGADAARV